MVSALGPELKARLKDLGLLSPVDPEAHSRWRAAPRLETVHGRVGGFLGNRKANANLLLQGVREFLDKDFELREGITADKYVYSRPAADDIIDDLASRCDFVVTAIADWGSCTACSVHDAMALENRGIPTIVICTDPFLDSAHRHAKVFGRNGFQPLGVPHPLGGISPEAVSQRASELHQQIIDALTTGE